MLYEYYFPLGIATGGAFLGRRDEQRILARNIVAGRHTLLISPRKYGKSSLVKTVIRKLKYPAVEIDLFLATSDKSIETKILKGTKLLLRSLSDKPETWLSTLTEYFKEQNKQWTIGIKGMSLELIPESHEDIAENILDALKALEYILKRKRQRAIFFIDEAQEISKVANFEAIEGAIRHFAQESSYLTLIFSGSNRHMLEHMFNDNSRPLYDLCEQIHLHRLQPNIYKTYLNKIAEKTWDQPLSDDSFNRIMTYTECHPKVVYILCKQIWDLCASNNSAPTASDVDIVWKKYIYSKLKDTRNELNKCSATQIRLLTLISTGTTSTLTSKEIQVSLNLSSSAIVQALYSLERKDYIERTDKNTYRIINPIIKRTLIAESKNKLVHMG